MLTTVQTKEHGYVLVEFVATYSIRKRLCLGNMENNERNIIRLRLLLKIRY